ncbi:hypothetical protein G6M50_36995 [Agrobacterium rhizogenes]|nr:hypothetical protein [Rhizobium rhizogenes]NTJ83385.1 hypothetical protein [Rhizobium rhizogenes]
MTDERIEKLERRVAELDGRCVMHELLIAQLLGTVGSSTGDIKGFVGSVLGNVARDLQSASKAAGAPQETRFAYAMKTLENFAGNMAGSLGGHPKGDLN